MRRFYFCFFFFQAEDGIRDKLVTGVQTCALPICTDRYTLVRRRTRRPFAATQPREITWARVLLMEASEPHGAARMGDEDGQEDNVPARSRRASPLHARLRRGPGHDGARGDARGDARADGHAGAPADDAGPVDGGSGERGGTDAGR